MWLREISICRRISTIFVDSCSLALSEKEPALKGKKMLPPRANSLLSELAHAHKGGQNDRVETKLLIFDSSPISRRYISQIFWY